MITLLRLCCWDLAGLGSEFGSGVEEEVGEERSADGGARSCVLHRFVRDECKCRLACLPACLGDRGRVKDAGRQRLTQPQGASSRRKQSASNSRRK